MKQTSSVEHLLKIIFRDGGMVTSLTLTDHQDPSPQRHYYCYKKTCFLCFLTEQPGFPALSKGAKYETSPSKIGRVSVLGF